MKYIFRGIEVFIYNPETKEMLVGTDHLDNNFNFCNFIPEDFKLISEFFQKAHEHASGQLKAEDLKDIEVN